MDACWAQASAAALAAACPGDGNRVCQAMAYGTFCDADADPSMFADAIDCLTAMSSAADGCRTFSDPSGASSCVDAVYAGVSNSDVDAVVTEYNGLCPAATIMPQQTEPPLYALTSAKLMMFKTCLDGAADCAAAGACGTTLSGAIAACYM